MVKEDREGYARMVGRLVGRRVGVLGDLMLDEYAWGHVTRISPEAPVPVVQVVEETCTLGGAGNVLMNLRALGGKPVAFGVVGNDEAARKVKELTDRVTGGRHCVLQDASRPTTLKKRIVAHHQHVVRVDKESSSPIAESFQKQILERLRTELPQLQALIVSDYNKGAVTRQFFDRIVLLALNADLPVFLDPKAFDLQGVGPITAISPNEREAEKISGMAIGDAASAEKAGRAILAYTGAKHVLITRGEYGMALLSAAAPPVHFPTQARQVFDITGAGDTVVATLALAVASGVSVADAARLANVAAGLVVGKMGTATVSGEELLAALNGDWPRADEHRAGKRMPHRAAE